MRRKNKVSDGKKYSVNSLPTRKKVSIPSREQIQAEREKIQYQNKYKKTLRSTIYALIVVAAIAVLIATLFIPVLQIAGTSMEPNLLDGDIVLLVKTKKFETGDLCSFAYQNKVLIKRIIGNAGDYIEMDDEGNVYVNGAALEEPYVIEKSLGECDIDFPYQVPENHYFVLGDHRSTSIDSRSSVIGCVKKDQIIGKVFVRIWPFNKISIIR